jgi:hypothetical protein
MPEVTSGAVLFGIVTAFLVRVLFRPKDGRRIPLWGAALIGVVAVLAGLPALGWVLAQWRATPWLPEITEGALFIGLWVTGVAAFVFERKDADRRVPIWVAVLAGAVATVTVPPLIDAMTGSYQRASLRANVNHCTEGMLGKVRPREVTNTCDFPITVGLCMATEENPDPCAQSVTIPPGDVALFDPGTETLSSMPSNADGLTVVACRLAHRPSRNLRVTGRGHEGVCLPAE